ncbi:MAG: F0F1 ATP synthase subunit delta [Legionella sp.]|nr:F0F1 ATP synthase subunit delta [Legionella sp.]
MSDVTTVARPYAKAAFEQALAENNLAEWSQTLSILAQVVLAPEAYQFITNPASTVDQHIELLQSIANVYAEESNQSLNNLVALLARNKRLMLLPEIKVLFESFKAEQEKTVSIDVVSFTALSEDQEQKLVDSMSKRLQRKVSLKVSIDPSLLGGAILRAGDLVIDGSILGKLNKLSADLMA